MSPLVLFILIAVIGGVLGTLLRLAVGGDRGTFFGCAVVAVAGGFLATNLAPAVGLDVGLALVAAVLAGTVVVVGNTQRKQELRDDLAMAEKVSDFGLGNFDVLDFNGDGLVTRMDLVQLSETDYLFDDEGVMMVYINSRLSVIGHAFDVSAHMPPMMGTGMGGPVYYTHYAISPEDFESWPRRLLAMYEQEFGPYKPDQA